MNGKTRKIIAVFGGALLLACVFMLSLFRGSMNNEGAGAAEIDKFIQGPVNNGTPQKIDERSYYAGIVSTIQDYGLYRPYFDYRVQNVTGTASTNAYACAGFVGAVLYYGGYGPEIRSDFRNWGYDSHNFWTGDKGYINYGHGSPELLTYYMGHYKYSNSTPATPYYSDASSNKWWKTGDKVKTDWISSWKLASYKVPEKNGGYSISVYNSLVDDYNSGKIAAGDVVVFIQWDSNSAAYYQTSITHIGILGAPTVRYDQNAVKKYLGDQYIPQDKLTSIKGAADESDMNKTALTLLNVTDNTDWYNQAIGCDPATDEQYKYHHAAYMPLPCFFDPNGTLGRRVKNPEKTSSVANGYIVYKLNDEICSEIGLHVYGDIAVDGLNDGDRRYGEAEFTAESEESCRAYISRDKGKSFERLKDEDAFKFEVKGGDADIYIVKAGDFNLDGKVDSTDALMILRYDVGKLEEADGLQLLTADVTGDSKVDSADALKVLRFDVGNTELE